MEHDTLPEVIETARLRLRPWELTDVEDVLSYAQDPEWSRYLRALPTPYNLRLDFEHRLAEMGYSVARRHWNQGYMTEAAGAAIDAAFTTHPDLNRLRAMADVDNTASQRVMEKVGMKQEGVLRQNRVERGEAIDEAWFGILRDEWIERTEGSPRG